MYRGNHAHERAGTFTQAFIYTLNCDSWTQNLLALNLTPRALDSQILDMKVQVRYKPRFEHTPDFKNRRELSLFDFILRTPQMISSPLGPGVAV